MSKEVITRCPYCDGDGCSECGDTGRRVATHLDAGDGITLHVHGNASLSPKAQDALAAVARAAFERMDAES